MEFGSQITTLFPTVPTYKEASVRSALEMHRVSE